MHGRDSGAAPPAGRSAGAGPSAAPSGPAGEILRVLGRKLRVGGIDYLNSRPLLEGLKEALGDGLELVNCVPSELAQRLRAGDLDAALVPVVEYFAGPPEYRIIPGIAIASWGAVESIRLVHRRPLGAVERVGLDRSSLTSTVLARLLFADLWQAGGPGPVFEGIGPEDGLRALSDPAGTYDAILWIGDRALEVSVPQGWEISDLGTAWTHWTGLPFVFAFWVYRGPPLAGLAGALRRARDLGRSRIDDIVARGPLPEGYPPERARRYLSHVIRHDLGPVEIEGLLEFRRRAAARGLIPGGALGMELRFLEGSEGVP